MPDELDAVSADAAADGMIYGINRDPAGFLMRRAQGMECRPADSGSNGEESKCVFSQDHGFPDPEIFFDGILGENGCFLLPLLV